MAEFRLTILNPTLARVFDVPVGITIIGREPSTNLPVLDPQVSRRHAQLISDGQICELIDMGSANGTFINDERLTPKAPVTLLDGMQIRFGPVEARFEILAAEPAPVEEAVPEPPEPDPDADEADTPGPEAELVLDLPVEPPPDPGLDVAAEALIAEPALPVDPIPPGGDGTQPPGSTVLDEPDNPFGLPGLSTHSRRLINFLPGIYQSDFMARFLGIFESIQTPIEWTLDAFDLYLDPDTSPSAFLSWLGSWYGLTFDASWSEDQRRLLIREAHSLFARRGTRWALGRVLEIYTGCTPDIADTGDDLEPFTFQVRLALPETAANRTLITRLIDAHKPAYTSYRLEFVK